MDEAFAKKLQEDEELQHQKQKEQVTEEENRLEKLWQEKKESRLAEEFERMQKQLSDELKQQMELNYQQMIQVNTSRHQNKTDNRDTKDTRTITKKPEEGRI